MPTLSPKRFTAFRIDEELLRGLEELRTRDGTPVSESVRRAIRAYLETKGIRVKEADRPRARTRRRS
jgi:hypothetical protein